MKYITKIFVFVLILSSGLSVLGQVKLAQTGMKFLQLSTDAKAAAMGDAVTALEGNSSSMFFNPAGMARLNKFADITIGQINYIADFKYYYFAGAFDPFEGEYGVVGFSFEYVDYGEFQATIRNGATESGYQDMGTFKPKAFCGGISYAKALSDKFSIGGNLKYAKQDLGTSYITYDYTMLSGETRSYQPTAIVYDFGMLYHTGFKSLDFGVSVRNFSKEIKLEQEGYQLPLMFQIGVAFNFADVLPLDRSMHSIQVAVDANHPRDFTEQLLVGVEYKLMNMFSIRAGNTSGNPEHSFTWGFGVQQKIDAYDFSFDYSNTPWKTFNNVHRFTFHFAFI